jgi:Abi-like protein
MSTSQLVFLYSLPEIQQLELLLSRERLNPYTQATAEETIKSYEKNTLLAEGTYGILQGLEIALRNSIHNVMVSGLAHPDWYNYVPWEARESDAIDGAKDALIKRNKAVSPGGIVSELTFGFWVQLTARKYEKLLWVPYVNKAFPAISTNRIGLNQRLNQIRKLRNRIAHHERILHFNLRMEYAQIIETVKWICPVTAMWIDSTNRLKKMLWP